MRSTRSSWFSFSFSFSEFRHFYGKRSFASGNLLADFFSCIVSTEERESGDSGEVEGGESGDGREEEVGGSADGGEVKGGESGDGGQVERRGWRQ